MNNLYNPIDIPLHIYYFAWKKTLTYLRQSDGIYDQIEIESFNENLDYNIKLLKNQIDSLNYKMDKPTPYLIPKSLKDGIPRARPMVQFSFRDQIAWATITLALSEWFDTNDDILTRIPLHSLKKREVYPWMVNWSYNNRIKRLIQVDELEGEMKRQFIHYNHNNLYESYQWGLRNLREARNEQFQIIRDKYGNAYYGELDIQEFYPSLKIEFVIEALDARISQLCKHKIINNECESNWKVLLRNMLEFKIDFLDTLSNPIHLESVNSLIKSIPLEIDSSDDIKINIEKLSEHLSNTLPIGLISSGFLSNCALTEYFDKRIDHYINITFQDDVYITRYTDDMMIIASTPENVYSVMSIAHKLLQEIHINISPDKCKPGEFIKENIVTDFNENIKDKFPIVKKRDKIPGSTAIIEKLSQFSDQKLWAMNNEQLIVYLNEMKQLLETKFDTSEIKDETKSVFAAWRIRSSANEVTIRKLAYSNNKIKETLRDAVYRYPHKFSFIEIYLIYLFESAEHLMIYEDLEFFLSCFKQNETLKINSDTDALGDMGPYVRTIVMNAIANNWKKLPTLSYDKVKAIIFKCISSWYITSPIWHEKAAMYWMLAVTNIKRDIGAVSPIYLGSENKYVQNMYRLYQVILQNTEYAFVISDSQIPSFDSSNVSLLKSVIYIFKLHYRNVNSETNYSNPEQWIKWYWDQLFKLEKYKNDIAYQTCVLELIKYDYNSAPVSAFEVLLKVNSTGNRNNNNQQDFVNRIIYFMDEIIDLWIDYPKEKKVVDRFLEAIRNTEDSYSKRYPVLKYVKSRILNLAWIKTHICKKKNGISKLPENLITSLNSSNNKQLPSILDWLAITRSSSLTDIERMTHPLSEYEILTLMLHINEGSIKTLRKTTISAEAWMKWRKDVITKDNPKKFKLVKALDSKIDPDQYYLQQANEYMNYLESKDNNFQNCFYQTVILIQLYSHGKIKASMFDLKNLLYWKGVQFVINNCGVPSSDIIMLITSTINHFYLFYKSQYEALSNIQLPYRPFYSNETVNSDQFFKVIKQTHQASKINYLNWENGFIEIRVQNLDNWIKE